MTLREKVEYDWKFRCPICDKKWEISGYMPFDSLRRHYGYDLNIRAINERVCSECKKTDD